MIQSISAEILSGARLADIDVLFGNMEDVFTGGITARTDVVIHDLLAVNVAPPVILVIVHVPTFWALRLTVFVSPPESFHRRPPLIGIRCHNIVLLLHTNKQSVHADYVSPFLRLGRRTVGEIKSL